MPEVHSSKLTKGSEFLILACDGIWEVLSDQEVRPHSHVDCSDRVVVKLVSWMVSGPPLIFLRGALSG